MSTIETKPDKKYHLAVASDDKAVLEEITRFLQQKEIKYECWEYEVDYTIKEYFTVYKAKFIDFKDNQWIDVK